jgi:hypothetical protein
LGAIPAGFLLGTVLLTEITYVRDAVVIVTGFVVILACCFWLGARQ